MISVSSVGQKASGIIFKNVLKRPDETEEVMVREHSRGHCPSERPRNFPFSRLLRVLQNEMKCKFNSLAVQTKVRKIWSAIRHVAWQLQEV